MDAKSRVGMVLVYNAAQQKKIEKVDREELVFHQNPENLFSFTKSATLAAFASGLQNRPFQPLVAKMGLWFEIARKWRQIDVYDV